MIVGEVHLRFNEQNEVDKQGTNEQIFRVTTSQNHKVDPETWGPRTWKHSIKLINAKPDWWATVQFYKSTAQGVIIPTVFWLFLLNGAYLGVYVYHSSTFAQILASPPYLFPNQDLGIVQVTQVVAATLVVPLLGYGSDFAVKLMSKSHRGIFEPEYRLLTLMLPVTLMIISCVIYGRAAETPKDWPWISIAMCYHLGFFAFNGANMVGITYLVDSVSPPPCPPFTRPPSNTPSVPQQSRTPPSPALRRPRLRLFRSELLHRARCAKTGF